jgi:bacterioferritin
MIGHPRLIGYLQRAVEHELGAAQQYTLQAVQAAALGNAAFAAVLREDAREELEHAEAFAQRLLVLGSTLRAGQSRAPQVGRSQEELLRFGLATEATAMRLYSEAGDFCRRIGDRENAELFDRIFDDEVRHYRKLEQDLGKSGGVRPADRIRQRR